MDLRNNDRRKKITPESCGRRVDSLHHGVYKKAGTVQRKSVAKSRTLQLSRGNTKTPKAWSACSCSRTLFYASFGVTWLLENLE